MPLVDVGSLAPDFVLTDQSGECRRLSDYRGRYVVLYFYPEDDTPLCTAQACQFRDSYREFAAAGAVVIGVSPQDAASKGRFARAHGLGFTLLGDEPTRDGSPHVCSLYGAWATKNMYGRQVVGILRTTYLIDPDGRVVQRWDRVKTPGHAAKVLEAILARSTDKLREVPARRSSGRSVAAKKTGVRKPAKSAAQKRSGSRRSG